MFAVDSKDHHSLFTALRAAITMIGMLAASTAYSQSPQDPYSLSLASPYGEDTHHVRNLAAFADNLAAATDNRIQVTLYTGAEPYSHNQIPRAVRTGRIEMGEVLMATLVDSDPIYALDNLPFIASDFSDARQMWDVAQPVVQASLDHRDGMVLLFAVPWPPQGLFSREPVAQLDDLRGTRMRTYSSTTDRLAELMGAIPVRVEAADVAGAFDRGEIDSMITSPTTGVSTEAWNFTRYYTDVQAWIPKNMVMINKRTYLDFSDGDRALIREVASAAETAGWQRAQETTAEDTRRLAEAGMSIVSPSTTLMEELESIGIRMAAEWVSRAGASVERTLNDYLALSQADELQPEPQPDPDRFDIGADGASLIDLATGLEWQRCSLGQRWDNGRCTGTTSRYNLTGVERAIESLNRRAEPVESNGHWRLPTLEELQSLVDCGPGGNTTGTFCTGQHPIPALVNGFSQLRPAWYWSSTPADHQPGEQMGLYLRAAHSYPLGRYGYRHHAVLVRER